MDWTCSIHERHENAHKCLVRKLVGKRPLPRPVFGRAPSGRGSREHGDKLSDFIKAGLPELLLAPQKRLSSMELFIIMERPKNHGSISDRARRLFSSPRGPDRLVFTDSPIQWAQRASYHGAKQPGREADHTALSNVKVKNVWSYTSTPLFVFMALFLIKHRKSLLFCL
jgi:hypothetical protein